MSTDDASTLINDASTLDTPDVDNDASAFVTPTPNAVYVGAIWASLFALCSNAINEHVTALKHNVPVWYMAHNGYIIGECSYCRGLASMWHADTFLGTSALFTCADAPQTRPTPNPLETRPTLTRTSSAFVCATCGAQTTLSGTSCVECSAQRADVTKRPRTKRAQMRNKLSLTQTPDERTERHLIPRQIRYRVNDVINFYKYLEIERADADTHDEHTYINYSDQYSFIAPCSTSCAYRLVYWRDSITDRRKLSIRDIVYVYPCHADTCHATPVPVAPVTSTTPVTPVTNETPVISGA